MQEDLQTLLSDRVLGIDGSGIRRAFELGASLENPINLSIGQPHFPVPQEMKDAAIAAIQDDQAGYSLTQGIGPLQDVIARHLQEDVGWSVGSSNYEAMVTSGTSGGLLLTAMALLDAGVDEADGSTVH